MHFKRVILLLTIFMMGWANASTETKQPGEKYNPVPDIMHHISDSHSWHLWGEGDKSIGFSLPVILWDNGLKIFSSSHFGHHEDEVAQVDGNYYKLYHNKIYKTDANGTLEMHEGHPSNERPLDFSITKNVAQTLLAAVLLIILAFATKSSYTSNGVPKGIAKFLEPLVLFVRDDIALENIGTKKYLKYTPYLVTLFLFIWIVNLLGLIPGAANVSGNIAFTMVLAVLTFIIVTFSGKKTYWSHIFDPLGNNMPWAGKALVYVILVPVEILGMFTKPFALMIRLFANMTAGHIVILSLISLIFIMETYAIAPVSIMLTLFINTLELLVAALQAYIFTLLTALFIGMAVEEGHH
ncbi:F0F1 ATP synthase subunit A [Riemerella anatipestifer]|nr:F0F1 ATP synthase subunit A [Riemerella anatipestifer]